MQRNILPIVRSIPFTAPRFYCLRYSTISQQNLALSKLLSAPVDRVAFFRFSAGKHPGCTPPRAERGSTSAVTCRRSLVATSPYQAYPARSPRQDLPGQGVSVSARDLRFAATCRTGRRGSKFTCGVRCAVCGVRCAVCGRTSCKRDVESIYTQVLAEQGRHSVPRLPHAS